MLQGIIAILIANSVVQGLVGRDKAGAKYKVYPVACPQPQDDPYIVLSVIEGSVFTRCKDTTGDMDDTPFNVYCYAKSYAAVDALWEAVRDAIDNYSGTSNGVKLKRVYLDDYKDGWDKDSGDGLFVRVSTYRAIVDVSVST